MAERYKVIRGTDAREQKLPGFEHERGRYDDDWVEVLYRCDDAGTPIEVVATDRMEPEDVSFGRDLGWIPVVLNQQADEIAQLQRELANCNRECAETVRNSGEEEEERAIKAERERDEAEHCQQEIARLESRLRAAEALVREYAESPLEDSCAICGAVLQPPEYLVPHCENCRVDDEHEQAYHDAVNAREARLAAWLEGRA